jgi:hypothetical protein
MSLSHLCTLQGIRRLQYFFIGHIANNNGVVKLIHICMEALNSRSVLLNFFSLFNTLSIATTLSLPSEYMSYGHFSNFSKVPLHSRTHGYLSPKVNTIKLSCPLSSPPLTPQVNSTKSICVAHIFALFQFQTSLILIKHALNNHPMM